MTNQTDAPVMGVARARTIERGIIALNLVALGFVIQPFSLTLFGIGFVLCVVGGLAFNLVPFCQPGKSLGSLIATGAIVLAVFVVVIIVALGVTELYSLSLRR
ncbi:MAG: hypothetical protein ACTSY1_11485 [Alphaproteobacteria bacterium]